MTTIYIVKVSGGQWDERWENYLKAFKCKENAEAFKNHLEENRPTYSEHFAKLLNRICFYAGSRADRIPTEYGFNYDEYDRVYEALVAKARAKYPEHTDDWEEANNWYSVEELELEE